MRSKIVLVLVLVLVLVHVGRRWFGPRDRFVNEDEYKYEDEDDFPSNIGFL